MKYLFVPEEIYFISGFSLITDQTLLMRGILGLPWSPPPCTQAWCNIGILFTQGTLRPIFESRLKQKRSVRERAMVLRKKVAEAGVNYCELSGIYKTQKEDAKEVSCFSFEHPQFYDDLTWFSSGQQR